MKLAEALALRAETTRRIEQLRSRIVDNTRYQEGEEPAEDAARLLAQTGEACADPESLIRRINRTNASAPMGTVAITDAIARRDVAPGMVLLRTRRSDVIDAAVVCLAADGDDILTSDSGDLRDLAQAADIHIELITV